MRWVGLLVLAPGMADAAALQPPVTPACISSLFGMRHAVGPHAPAAFHNGVDLPAPAGALVRAAADGTVAIIKRQGLGGVTVHVVHPDGLRTLYAHLGTLAPAIAEGKRVVKAGDPLGHVARTGVTYGTHVFFAVLRGAEAIDPEPLLGVPRCKGPSDGRSSAADPPGGGQDAGLTKPGRPPGADGLSHTPPSRPPPGGSAGARSF